MSDDFADEISGGPKRPRNRALAWATLAVLAAVAVSGGAYALTRGPSGGGPSTVATAEPAADTTSPSPSPSASRNKRDNAGRHGPGGPMVRGPLGAFGVGGQLLHGESTVRTKDGTTQVVDTQRGTISSIDSTAKTITVTSSDKVSFTYVVVADTRLVVFGAAKPAQATFANLKKGDTVALVAIRSGDRRTATSVVDGRPTPRDRTGRPGQGHRQRPAEGPAQGPVAPFGTPAPSPSASTASA
jgi:hypothetical protein